MSSNLLSLKLCLDSQTAQKLEDQDNSAFDLRDLSASGEGDLSISPNVNPGVCNEYVFVVDPNKIKNNQNLKRIFSSFWENNRTDLESGLIDLPVHPDEWNQLEQLAHSEKNEDQHVGPNYKAPELAATASLPPAPFPRRFTINPADLTRALVRSMMNEGESVPVELTGDGGYGLTLYVEYDGGTDLGFRIDTGHDASFTNSQGMQSTSEITARGASYQIDRNPPCYINLAPGVVILQTDSAVRPEELQRLREEAVRATQFESVSTDEGNTFRFEDTEVTLTRERENLHLTISENGTTQNVTIPSQVLRGQTPPEDCLLFKLPWGRDVLVNRSGEMVIAEARGMWTPTTARTAIEKGVRIGRASENPISQKETSPVLLGEPALLPLAEPPQPSPSVSQAAPPPAPVAVAPSVEPSLAPPPEAAPPASPPVVAPVVTATPTPPAPRARREAVEATVTVPSGAQFPQEPNGRVPCTIVIRDGDRTITIFAHLRSERGRNDYVPVYDQATYEVRDSSGQLITPRTVLRYESAAAHGQGITFGYERGQPRATYFVRVTLTSPGTFTVKGERTFSPQQNYKPYGVPAREPEPLPEFSHPTAPTTPTPAPVVVERPAAPASVAVAPPQGPSAMLPVTSLGDRPADSASSASVEVILPEGTVLPEGRELIPCTIRIEDKGRVVTLAVVLQKPVGSSIYKPNYEKATYDGDAKEAKGSSGLSTTGTKMYSRGVTIIWADGEVATYFVEVEGKAGGAHFTSKVRARSGAQYNYTPFELGRTGEPEASRPLSEPSRPLARPEPKPAPVEVASSAAPGLESPSEPALRVPVTDPSTAAEPDPVVPVDSAQASESHPVEISSQMRSQINEARWGVDTFTTVAGRQFNNNLRLAILDTNLAPILTIWLWSLHSGNRARRDTATLVPLLDRYIENDPSVTEQTIIEALQPRLPILRDAEITNLLAETLIARPSSSRARLSGIYLILGEVALSFPEETMSEPIRQRVIATLGEIRSGLKAYQPKGSHRVISGDADYIRDLIRLSEYESRINQGGFRSYGQQDGGAIVERILSRPPSELDDSLFTLRKMFETGPHGATTFDKIRALLGRAGHEGGFAGSRTASYYNSGSAQRDVRAWLAEGFSIGKIKRLLSQRYSAGVRAQLSHWVDVEGGRLQNSKHHARFQTQAETFAGQLAAQHGEYNPLVLAFRSEGRRNALALDLHRQAGALELTSPALAQAKAHEVYKTHIESVTGTVMKSGHAVMPGFILGHAAVSALRGEGNFGENAVMGGFGAIGFSLVDKMMQTAVSVFTNAEKLNFKQLALSAGLAAFVINTGMAVHNMSEDQMADMSFGDWAGFFAGHAAEAIALDGFAFLGISHFIGGGSTNLFGQFLSRYNLGSLAPYLVPFASGMTGMEVASLSTHGLRGLGEEVGGFFRSSTHFTNETRAPERVYDQRGSLNPMLF